VLDELGLATQQALSLRAAGDVSLGVVDERVLSENRVRRSKAGRGKYARMPASSPPTMFSLVPSVVAPVTWSGRSWRRKQTRQSRSRSGTFSMTSAGVTSAATMMRCFPPSTMEWSW
jgi:hypothetical protein